MTYEEERKRLIDAGFEGFVAVSRLMADMSVVPNVPGVYALLRESSDAPMFLEKGTGGFHKDKDPNVGIAELESSWVEDSSIMYFGKTGKTGGAGKNATLRKRLGDYMKFGQGRSVGHKGGRYVWQLADAKDLLVCWKTLDVAVAEPREVERQLISDFKAEHGGRRPFANLQD